MRTRLTRALFVRMLREEWRMQVRQFGAARYAAFPLLAFALCTVAIQGLLAVGLDLPGLVAAMHALALVFGVQTGVVGLVGGDAVGTRPGDDALVLHSAETLPVSRARLLGTYAVKDLVYYSALFLLPFALSVVPAAAGTSLAGRVPLLWASTAGTFMVGGLTTMALAGCYRRGLDRRTAGVAAGVAGAGAAVWLAPVDPLALTPYAWFVSPSPASALTGAVPIALAAGAGLATYDLQPASGPRAARGRARALARLPGADHVVAKTLLDLSRTGGGLATVPFSAGVLVAAGLGIVLVVERLLGVAPSYPVLLGGVAGLTALTSYNWLTTYDGLEDYETLPLDEADVLAGKRRAFQLVGLPTGLAAYLAAVALVGGTPDAVLAGAALAVGVQLFQFGLAVRLAGLAGDAFLFDTAVFAVFVAAVAAVLVPVLVVGLLSAPLAPAALAGVAAWGVGSGGVGMALYRRRVGGVGTGPPHL